jgi:hypothetical protein
MDPQTEDNTWGTASQPQPGAVNSERQVRDAEVRVVVDVSPA